VLGFPETMGLEQVAAVSLKEAWRSDCQTAKRGLSSGYEPPDPGHEFRVIFLVRRQGLP